MSNKNKVFTIIIAITLIVLIVGLSGCGKSKTPTKTPSTSQCKTDDTCIKLLNKTLKQCMSAYCTAGVCKTRVTQNCCGNNISEEIEDGLPGSKCSCPKDYGTCNATIKYSDATNRLVNAKYIVRKCVENECKIVYDESLQRDSEFFNIWNGAGFTINTYVIYSNPFFEDNTLLEIRMKLKDYEPTQLHPPIIIKEIRLMEGTKILSKVNPSMALAVIDQNTNATINVKYYDFIYPEEAKSLTLSIDYEYTPLRAKTEKIDGETITSYVPQPIERKTQIISLTDRITFLDKSLITE